MTERPGGRDDRYRDDRDRNYAERGRRRSRPPVRRARPATTASAWKIPEDLGLVVDGVAT